MSSPVRSRVTGKDLSVNPFSLPSDAEIFKERERERERKRDEKEKMKSLHVWEKSNVGKLANRKAELMAEIDEVAKEEGSTSPDLDTTKQKKDKDRVHLPAIENKKKERENTRDFIAKKREMFLIEMSLETKRAEIKKLEELAAQREALLRKNEKMLEEDAVRFDTFLKENASLAMGAMKLAEAETKAKAEKIAEIKKLTAQISAIKSDMSKAEDKLFNCAQYKKFLDELTPPEWIEEQKELKRKRKEMREKKRKEERERREAEFAEEMARERELGISHEIPGPKESKSRFIDDQADEDSGDELPMYFKDPVQLLDIFTALEEKNLFLIQNSQETEEALEDLRRKFKETREKMDDEVTGLKHQITKLHSAIAKEENRLATLTIRAKRGKEGGESSKEVQLKNLHAKVSEVYREAGFDNTGLSVLEMLTAIEAKLTVLLSSVAKMDASAVQAAEKKREIGRRLKMREDKLEQNRIAQELRLKKSLERSKAPVVKRVGKQVMFRSRPNENVSNDQDKFKRTADEEDEIREFFM